MASAVDVPKRNSAIFDVSELNKDLARMKVSGVQKSRSGIFGFGGDSPRKKEEKNLEERIKSEIFANNLMKGRNEFLNNLKQDPGNKNAHKRQESDSRISLNFVRGFRRENTDFFPLSKRHSAVLDQASSPAAAVPQVPLRSSAIFRRFNQNKGEPILTDFVSSRDLETSAQQPPRNQQAPLQVRNLRPRREKTESVIVLKNRQVPSNSSPLNQQQVKTLIKTHTQNRASPSSSSSSNT